MLKFFSDEEFIDALSIAQSANEQENVIDNYISFLTQNYQDADEAIAYLKSFRPEVPKDESRFKRIIVNFNGTACPSFLKSVHDEYLFTQMGQQYVDVKNVPGVGINARHNILENVVDLGDADSVSTRIQNILDYIEHHATPDCEIDILGHSRGAAEAMILARIISQKYPHVKVIAHDPVPGYKVIPFLQSYYDEQLNVAHFLGAHSLITIRSILEDQQLSIKGAVMLPGQKDEMRSDFAFLEQAAYGAEYFFPVELPGFHNMWVYDDTDVDYSVIWEKFPAISSGIRNRNRKAHQGEDVLDSQRNAIKAESQKEYNELVMLFTQAQVHDKLSAERFSEALAALRKETYRSAPRKCTTASS